MAKQAMSALDIRAAVREMQRLVGARVEKIYEILPGEFLVRVRVPPRGEQPAEKVDISLLVGKAVHETTFKRDAPTKPTGFVMNLRKHLVGGFFDEVRQHGFDRVVEFVLNRKDGTFRLVVELFGDGNLVLVKDERIIMPLRHQSWAHRQVRPGAAWSPPPDRADPSSITVAAIAEAFAGSTADAVRTLATVLDLGGPLAQEVCVRADLAKDTPASSVTAEQHTALQQALQDVLASVQTGTISPVVVTAGEEMIDVAPIRDHADTLGHDIKTFATFQQALDAYFGHTVTVEREDPRLTKVKDEQSRTQRMLKAQEAAVAKFEKEEAEGRRKGDLLYAHFDITSKTLATLNAAAKQLGWKEVEERLKEGRKQGNPDAMVVQQLDPHQGQLVFALNDEQGKSMRVKVDVRKSVQENADACYEYAKKMRDKQKGAHEALARTRAQIEQLAAHGLAVVEKIEAHQKKKEQATRRFWFESYRWFMTTDGHIVVAGRDVRSNERVVAKILKDRDRYLHAEVSGAPSTVVKADEAGEVSDSSLAEAASFAASMSRIWTAGHAEGQAYWVTPEQVSKTPNPGEFVAKGSFIVRGKRTFVRGEIRLAIGEVEIDGHRKVMGGPVAAVKARAKRYVVLEPGRTATNKLANQLARVFDVPVEEVQTVMPPAPVEIVEAVGIDLK